MSHASFIIVSKRLYGYALNVDSDSGALKTQDTPKITTGPMRGLNAVGLALPSKTVLAATHNKTQTLPQLRFVCVCVPDDVDGGCGFEASSHG